MVRLNLGGKRSLTLHSVPTLDHFLNPDFLRDREHVHLFLVPPNEDERGIVKLVFPNYGLMHIENKVIRSETNGRVLNFPVDRRLFIHLKRKFSNPEIPDLEAERYTLSHKGEIDIRRVEEKRFTNRLVYYTEDDLPERVYAALAGENIPYVELRPSSFIEMMYR